MDVSRALIVDQLLHVSHQGHPLNFFATSIDWNASSAQVNAQIMLESMGSFKVGSAMLRPIDGSYGLGFKRTVIPLAFSDSQLVTGSDGLEGLLQMVYLFMRFGIRLTLSNGRPPYSPWQSVHCVLDGVYEDPRGSEEGGRQDQGGHWQEGFCE